MTDVQAECLRKIAESKGLPTETLTLDTPLASIDVDSLDRVSFAFDLEEQYGVELPEHQIHQIQTVGDVAEAIQQALLKKGTSGNMAGHA